MELICVFKDYSDDLDLPSRSNWTTLTLEIIDEDDQNPTFTHRWHYLTIQEEVCMFPYTAITTDSSSSSNVLLMFGHAILEITSLARCGRIRLSNLNFKL